MRIFRSLLILVLLVFATNALYIQGQWIVHNHDQGIWQAVWYVLEGWWWVTLSAIVILLLVLYWDWRSQKKDDDERFKTTKLLEAIAQKLGVDTSNISNSGRKNGKHKSIKPNK
jgi:hypothetical protein